MGLSRTNLKKLASLSALGAGSVALTATNAEAAIIHQTLDLKVGFDVANGYMDRVEVLLPGFPGLGFSFLRASAGPYGRVIGALGFSTITTLTTSLGSTLTTVAFLSFRGLAGGPFGYLAGAFNKGVRWNDLPGTSLSAGPVAGRIWNSSSGFPPMAFPESFTEKYALFRFFPDGCSCNSLYGWIHLQLQNEAQSGPNDSFGPNLRILGWAYDDQGNEIAAGAIGHVPEPGTFVLTGLAALVLGASGVRRWRTARKAAA